MGFDDNRKSCRTSLCKRARDGESHTTWTHHVSSWYAVITEPSPVVCRSRMMITFERVWPVGRFGVGRSLFVVPQQRRAGTVPHLLCFRDIPGHTKPQRAKKGCNRAKKGYFSNLVEAEGYTLAQASQKGVLVHTPLLITLVHPLNTRGKKKNSGWLGGFQRSRLAQADFDVESILRIK